jgi:hypothetical protein
VTRSKIAAQVAGSQVDRGCCRSDRVQLSRRDDADVAHRAVWGNPRGVRLGAIVLVGLVLAGCGDEPQAKRDATSTTSSAERAAPENARAAPSSSAQDPAFENDPAAAPASDGHAEGELQRLFARYHAAWDARDWDALCRTIAPEVTEEVRGTLEKVGGDPNPPRACPDAHEQLHDLVGHDLADELDGDMAQTRELDSVNVKGETAFLNYHYTDEGTRKDLTQHARQIDGEWKLID